MHGPQMSKKVDYGLRAMVRLGQNPPGLTMNFRDIAACEGIPDSYLAKILRCLVVAELVKSIRGAGGGYRLAKPPGQISILAIMEAIDGPIALNDCQTEPGCPQMGGCTLHGVFDRAQSAMLEVFKTSSLASVLPANAAVPPQYYR